MKVFYFYGISKIVLNLAAIPVLPHELYEIFFFESKHIFH
jgi:hypothetical protein